jgi:multiple sugar transport system substrate-binding protein
MQHLPSLQWTRRFTRELALVGLALVFIVPLAACGGGSSSGGGATSSGPVNLTYWGWIPGTDKMVAAWNQTHPNIHVTWVQTPGGAPTYAKMFTAIKANNEPDLGQVEFQELPTFKATGALVDLAPYGAASVKDQFVPWTWSQVTLGNAIYAIPGDTGPLGLYYRADLFQKYNIPVPTTWAQFADDAAKLHAADHNVYITDFPPTSVGWFMGLAWQNGARFFNISGQSWVVSMNNPQAQQVASFWQDLLTKKLVTTETDFTTGFYHDLGTGKIATWIGAPWTASSLSTNVPSGSGKWRVAPIPQWQAGGTADGNWGGSTEVVFKSSQHPKEAAEFAEWLYTDETPVEDYITLAGGYPAKLAALSSKTLNSPTPYFQNQNLNEVFKVAAPEVNVNFQWGPTMNQVTNDISDNFSNAANGKTTLVAALNTVQQSTVAFMKKQGFSVSG